MSDRHKHFFPFVQLHAGYVLQSVYEELARLVSPPEATGVDKLCGLYAQLSAFELSADFDCQPAQPVSDHSSWVVLSNLVSRGVPTWATAEIEEAFSQSFQKSVRQVSGGEISYSSRLQPEEVKNLF